MSHVFRYLVDGPPIPGQTVALTDADSHHLAHVVRRGVGDRVELMDGRGGIWAGEVASLASGAVVEVGERRPASPVPDVVLYVGTMDQSRLDIVVEKTAELGVPELVVFSSARSRRVPDREAWERRADRRGRVVEAAARQAGQAVLSEVRGVVPLDAVLPEIPSGEGFILDREGEEPLGAALAGRCRARLVVGPDAGFDPAELSAARDAGLRVCTIGPATLRAETAALVGLTLALDAVGYLGRAQVA